MARTLLTLADLPANPRELLARRLTEVRASADAAATRAARDPADVEILVVSKYVDGDVFQLLWELGVREFAENRVQEGLRKRELLDDLVRVGATRQAGRIHFIGHLQRNKARAAIRAFSSIHSLDSVRLARELDSRLAALAQLPEAERSPTPDLFLEVNVSEESQRTGAPLETIDELLDEIATLPHVREAIRGWMAMAPYCDDPGETRPYFARVRELRDAALRDGRLPEHATGLSLGMSRDFEIAIEEGATVVRVGSMLYRETP